MVLASRVKTDPPRQGGGRPASLLAVGLLLVTAALASGCSLGAAGAGPTRPGVIGAIGAESQYANVLAQIGGRYVQVASILANPNTDPHTFESSPSVAAEVSSARLIVQNGAGYDTFMNRIESASPSSRRKVIDVRQLLGLPSQVPNPHLWYAPSTMPRVAQAMAGDLSEIAPAHAAYFGANLATFDHSLQPWLKAIAAFKARHAGTPAATTEPVADYLLQAMGIDNLTPFRFQAEVMNGVDPAPQDISSQEADFTSRRVKVLCYNEQVVDPLTAAIKGAAERAGIPVVGVYETMPPGYDYQSWMLAETASIRRAVTAGISTGHL